MPDNTYIFDVIPRPNGGSIVNVTEDGSGIDTIVVNGSHPEGGTVGVVLARIEDETLAVARYSFERTVDGLDIQDGYEHRFSGGRIENAIGGVGRERLEGNSASNILIGDPTRSGPGGADQILGMGGDDFLYGGAGDDNISGGTGDDQIFGDADNDTLSGGDGTDYIEGGSGSDRLNGGNGDDLLIGGTGIDTLNGDAGNDVLIGGADNDTINGGAGYDISVYSGAREGYTTVASNRVVGGVEGGTDTITAIETLAFVDGQLTFHRDGMAAQVMRLYDSAFNRIPDASGFEAQLDAMEDGTSLNALAQLFVNSVEFQNTYGALSDRAFVEQLYRNVLNREGDAAGINNAVNELLSGKTRGEVLVAFSESTEHKNLTQGTLDQGLWIADEQTLIIARLYDAAWNRLPDEGGLINWRNALGAGTSLEAIAQAFAASTEFQNTYGALTDRQFVEQLYRNVLDREGDEAGILNALNAITGGQSRGDIMLAFSESVEHVALTRPLWIGGVSLFGSSSASTEAKDAGEPQTLPGVEDFIPLGAGADYDALPLSGLDDSFALLEDVDQAPVLPGAKDAWMVVIPLDHPTFEQGPDRLDDYFIGLSGDDWVS